MQYWPIEIGSMLKYCFRVGHQPFIISELEVYWQKLNGKSAWNNWHLHALVLMHFLLSSFFVPAGIGIQELAFVVIGNYVGLSPSIAFSVAIGRRVREFLVGIPAIVAWLIFFQKNLRIKKGLDN